MRSAPPSTGATVADEIALLSEQLRRDRAERERLETRCRDLDRAAREVAAENERLRAELEAARAVVEAARAVVEYAREMLDAPPVGRERIRLRDALARHDAARESKTAERVLGVRSE